MAARILIIENHPDNQKLMAFLLERSGYCVVVANTGEAGIEAASNAQFDLILCDICMPGIDGYEVARRLKATPHLRRTPLVAVTAMIHPGDHEQALAAGFDGYVAKATAPQHFIQQVQSFLLFKATSPEESAPEAVPAENPESGNKQDCRTGGDHHD